MDTRAYICKTEISSVISMDMEDNTIDKITKWITIAASLYFVISLVF
ncbi:MAG: hypothetical protein HQK89_01355 [Nitrospirae bacterium]|nr:hypothetical protein [Nitrospirota bacterium]